MLSSAAAVFAADSWTLTTTDFQTRAVAFTALDGRTLSVIAPPSTQPSAIDLSQFLCIDRAASSARQPTKFILQTRDGDRLSGEPESLDGDTLHWREAIVGSIAVPMAEVIGLSRGGRQLLDATPPTQDIATLANGDVLRGVISDLNAKSVSMQRPDGSMTPLSIDSLSEVRFASTVQSATSPATNAASDAYFRATLVDGSRLSANDLAVQPPSVSLTLSDHVHRLLSLESVRSIEQVDGPVQWLSAAKPTESVQIPLTGRARPARFDRTMAGAPIQFGDRIYAHGIGVHAYSRLSWPIGARDRFFRTQFAIDGDAPYAIVNVRIKLDGQIASETANFRTRILSPVILLDVSQAHTITLEVEDTSNDNIQARLNWIEPAILRFNPATPH
ncbi:MAG: NPCBM/NEW2 domain-containing protein [Phycisphaerae bacterium]|nr:NPCBM/NEW2 domain-containing protein [Phycisphaerae bacterium]